MLGPQLVGHAWPKQYFADGFGITDGATRCGLTQVTSVKGRSSDVDNLPNSPAFLGLMSQNLKEIDLGNNPGITVLPAAWSQLAALQELVLDNTEVSNLPFSLCDSSTTSNATRIQRLKRLDLTGTPASKSLNWRGQVPTTGKARTPFGRTMQQTWISPACLDAIKETLESWVMADNNISDSGLSSLIKDVFGQMTSLKRLDVSNNQIQGSALLAVRNNDSFIPINDVRLLLQGNPLRVEPLFGALHKLGVNSMLVKGWLGILFPDAAENNTSVDAMVLKRGSAWVELPSQVQLDLKGIELDAKKGKGTDPSEFISFDLYATTLTKLGVQDATCAGSWAESKWLHQLGQLTHLNVIEMHPAPNSDCTLPTGMFGGLNKLVELTIAVASPTTPVKFSRGTFQGLSNVRTMYVRRCRRVVVRVALTYFRARGRF